MSLQNLEYANELTVSWAPPVEAAFSTQLQLATVDLDLSAPPDWEIEADKRLRALALLPKGWNGPNSGPIGAAMAGYIRSILSSVMSFDTPAPSFVPAHGGAVQVEWHRNGLDVELMIYRPFEAELSVLFHDGRPPIEDEPISAEFDEMSEVLCELS